MFNEVVIDNEIEGVGEGQTVAGLPAASAERGSQGRQGGDNLHAFSWQRQFEHSCQRQNAYVPEGGKLQRNCWQTISDGRGGGVCRFVFRKKLTFIMTASMLAASQRRWRQLMILHVQSRPRTISAAASADAVSYFAKY